MGLPTTDQKNPGRRQVQQYSVSGGLSASKADSAETRPISFSILKNCLVDKRIGALVKRAGSTTETIASSLGLPLGIGEHVVADPGSIPINRTLLVNFAGTFKQHQNNVWAAVTKTSYTDFATSRLSQFAKLGTKTYIAAGRPAKWGGPGTSIDRVGIVPPSQPITITSSSTGSGITLLDGAQYMYTYFDSVTGLESDWSPLSDVVPAIDDNSIVISIPVTTLQNFDRIRLYRTLDGGTAPYLVDTVITTTTSYTDSKPDELLTAPAAARYEKGLPPTSFIVAKYANCIWYVDAEDAHRLVFSKPYTGADTDCEYIPEDNFVITDEPITGLKVVPGKLLIFHPRNISQVTGYSIDDFVLQAWMPGTGTVFPNSISTNGSEIVYLAEQGFVSIPAQGGAPRHISREIDLDLQPLLSGSYNAALFVSSCWNPAMRQFIFMLSAFSTVGSPWETVGTGALGEWEDSGTLVTDIWQNADGVDGTATLKIRLWGWSPELSKQGDDTWHEYTFPQFADANVANAYPLFLFHPQPSADTSDPQQDKTFVGFFSGTEGKILTAFRRDKNLDDSTVITAEWLTDRMSPGVQTGGYKLFQYLGFMNSYSDPTSDSLCTLKYLLDFDDPQIRSYSGSLVTISGSTDMKTLTSNSGRHIRLYGTDTSQSQTKILLSEFFIHFRERFRRGGR